MTFINQDYRDLILYLYSEGMPVEDICDTIGIDYKTVNEILDMIIPYL